jgi:hypothetical protein
LLTNSEISILMRQNEVLPGGQGLTAKALIGGQSPNSDRGGCEIGQDGQTPALRTRSRG